MRPFVKDYFARSKEQKYFFNFEQKFIFYLRLTLCMFYVFHVEAIP